MGITARRINVDECSARAGTSDQELRERITRFTRLTMAFLETAADVANAHLLLLKEWQLRRMFAGKLTVRIVQHLRHDRLEEVMSAFERTYHNP